jgi:hypothetical protein
LISVGDGTGYGNSGRKYNFYYYPKPQISQNPLLGPDLITLIPVGEELKILKQATLFPYSLNMAFMLSSINNVYI